MAFVFFKLSLYILILLSFTLQTTARRSSMLPSPNDTETTNTAIPPSNDTEPPLTNDNNITTPTDINDTESDTEPALTNDNNISSQTDTNDIEPTFTNDDTPPTPTTENDNGIPYPETTVPQTDEDFFTPDPENDTSSTTLPQNENDVVLSPTPDFNDYNQNDMSFSPAPAPAPSSDYSAADGDFFDYENSPPNVAPATPAADDYDGEWTAPAADKPTVVPSTYEADDEVDPELAAEIEAYTAARERNSRAFVVVLGFACLIGVGGFVYKKRKEDLAKKSQYQYLSKRDENIQL